MCARFNLMRPWADVVRLLGGNIRAAMHGNREQRVKQVDQ
jgi:hypothetical protein